MTYFLKYSKIESFSIHKKGKAYGRFAETL